MAISTAEAQHYLAGSGNNGFGSVFGAVTHEKGDEFKVDKPLGFADFRERLSLQMMEYDPAPPYSAEV